MSEFKVGDRIRVIPSEINGFLVEYQKKVKHRVAIVESVFVLAGDTRKSYRVLWQKRNGRGKEFSEILRGERFYEVAPC